MDVADLRMKEIAPYRTMVTAALDRNSRRCGPSGALSLQSRLEVWRAGQLAPSVANCGLPIPIAMMIVVAVVPAVMPAIAAMIVAVPSASCFRDV